MAAAPENSTEPSNLEAWRDWLCANHQRDQGVWLIYFKKGYRDGSLTVEEAILEALCWGWIDSKPNKLDGSRSLLWFAPRNPGTGWSRINKQRVEWLLAQNRMQPAGMVKILEAQKDGSWSKLDAVEELVIPPDLLQAFDRFPGAREQFEAFPRSAKRGILEWILQAKREETRSKRIEETACLAQQGKRANQWPRD